MSAQGPDDNINPELEEDVEEHFEELYARDKGFRAEWDERKLSRELGDRLLERRLERGLSQRELAQSIGTSQNRIYLIENGEANPTLDTLERLAKVLGAHLTVGLPRPLHSHTRYATTQLALHILPGACQPRFRPVL